MSLIQHFTYNDTLNSHVGVAPSVGTSTAFIDAKLGKGIDVLGTGGSLQYVPSNMGMDFNNTKEWSISCWVLPDEASWIATSARHNIWEIGSYYIGGESSLLLGRHALNSTTKSIWLTNYENLVGKGTAGAHVFTSTDLANWIFLVVTYDGTALYQHSVAVGSGYRVTGATRTLDTTTYPFRDNLFVGGYGWDSDAWRGGIDDLRIYDHVLSTREIKELSRAKVLHYTFDDFQEPTTNLVPTGYLDGTTLYGSYNYDATGTRVHEWTSDYYKGARISHYYTGTTGYKYFALTMTGLVDGATYTFSYYAKASITTNINNLQLWRGVTDRPFTPDQNPTFTTSWKRYTGTATVSGGTLLHFFPVHGSSITGGIDLWFAGFQLEQKDHATPFVDGSRTGIVRDSSGQGNDSTALTETYTPEWTEESKIGSGSYFFDNTRDTYIQAFTPTQAATWLLEADPDEVISVCCWAKCNTTSGESISRIISRDASAYWAITMQQHIAFPQNIIFYNVGGGAFTASGKVNNNEWFHVALVRDVANNESRFFVNGIKLNTTTATTGGSSGAEASRGITIGHNEEGGPSVASTTSAFKGWIDDIRVYRTALTDEDIYEIYSVRASIDSGGSLWVS